MILSQFISKCELVKEKFLKINSKVLLITHKDCDGVTSAYLMIQLLKHLGIKYELRTYQFLDDKSIYRLGKEDFDTIIFTDFGSAYLDLLEDALSSKQVFVFDHHFIKGKLIEINHLNVRDFDNVSDTYSCAASVVYNFINIFKDFCDLSPVGIIGAVGDYQLKHQVEGLNKVVVDDAIKNGLISLSKDLNVYGKQSRPLHKSLGRCDFSVPGIKNDNDALEFLKSIGVYDSKWLSYNDLSDEKKNLLIDEIKKRREGDDSDIYSNNITFKFNTKLKDAFEYSTLVNSQIRMDKIDNALELCSFSDDSINKAFKEKQNYQSELKKALDFIENAVKIESDKIVIINVLNNLKPELISTVSSIMSKSRKYKDGTLLCIIGRINENESKISTRVCGLKKQSIVNAKQILEDTLKGVSINVGGHNDAAGAVIHTIDEQKVIEKLKQI